MTEVAWLEILIALNQLFVDQISWFFFLSADIEKKSNWDPKNFDLILSAATPAHQLISADKMRLKFFWSQFNFFSMSAGRKKISWFGPQTAELEQSKSLITQPQSWFLESADLFMISISCQSLVEICQLIQQLQLFKVKLQKLDIFSCCSWTRRWILTKPWPHAKEKGLLSWAKRILKSDGWFPRYQTRKNGCDLKSSPCTSCKV